MTGIALGCTVIMGFEPNGIRIQANASHCFNLTSHIAICTGMGNYHSWLMMGFLLRFIVRQPIHQIVAPVVPNKYPGLQINLTCQVSVDDIFEVTIAMVQVRWQLSLAGNESDAMALPVERVSPGIYEGILALYNLTYEEQGNYSCDSLVFVSTGGTDLQVQGIPAQYFISLERE